MNTMESTQTELTTKFDGIVTTAQNLVSNVEGRLLWLEVLKALDSALPKDLRPAEERKETEFDVTARNELHVSSMDCEYMDAAATEAWYQAVAPMIADAKAATFRQKKPAAAPAEGAVDGAAEGGVPGEAGVEVVAGEEAAAEVPAEAPADAGLDGQVVDDGSGVPVEGAADAAGPTGPGWVIQLKGYHFHNTYPGKPELTFTNDEGMEFIENTFFKALEEGTIQLPDGPGGALVDVPITKLGIQCPVVTTANPPIDVTYLPEAVDGESSSQLANRMPEGGRGATDDAAPALPKIWKLRRYDFTIQMYWKPTPRTARQEKPATAEGGEAVDTVSVGDSAGPTG